MAESVIALRAFEMAVVMFALAALMLAFMAAFMFKMVMAFGAMVMMAAFITARQRSHLLFSVSMYTIHT